MSISTNQILTVFSNQKGHEPDPSDPLHRNRFLLTIAANKSTGSPERQQSL